MIDIHTHIIPNIDDGSKSMESSLAMVKEMISQGIDKIICTPHYRGHFVATTEEVEKKFSDFSEEVKKQGLKVQLYLGRELNISPQTEDFLFHHELQTMNNTQYILAEYPFSREYDIVESVYKMGLYNFKPIVAHIERYSYVDLDTAYEVKKVGGLIQINATSLFESDFGTKRYVKKLLKHDLVDFISSDAHFGRKNYMAKAYKLIKKKYGTERANALFNDNAEVIIKG